MLKNKLLFAVLACVLAAAPAKAQAPDPAASEQNRSVTEPKAPTAAAPEAPSATSAAPQPEPDTSPLPLPSADPANRPMPELSVSSMFMEADVVVKAVMIGLAFASFLTWSVLLGKSLELYLAKRRLRRSLRRIEQAGSLDEAFVAVGANRDIVSRFVREAYDETRLSSDIIQDGGVSNRVASRFGEAIKDEARDIRRGMGLLATIGSTAPFVGLFGTVWGIMNSFIGISKAQTTNLAIVAPGIAEALLATAIGLVAAIPAVIFYNHFSRVTKSFLDETSRAGGFVGRLLSRDLDRVRASDGSRAPIGQ